MTDAPPNVPSPDGLPANLPDAGASAWEAARVRRHLLSLENRQRLADHVERHPGVHLRRLARDLGLAIGTTEHHLHLLVRHGVLERHDQGGHAAYFVAGACPDPERRLLCALRGDTPRRLLRALAADPDLGTAALAARLGLSRSAVAHHLARLVAEGLLERLRVGRSTLLQVRDPAALAKALAVHDRHHPALPWPGFRAEPVQRPSASPPIPVRDAEEDRPEEASLLAGPPVEVVRPPGHARSSTA
jgi:DNA-binding MarR family transcriptional regulator